MHFHFWETITETFPKAFFEEEVKRKNFRIMRAVSTYPHGNRTGKRLQVVRSHQNNVFILKHEFY